VKAFALVSALLAQTPAAGSAPAPAVNGAVVRNTLQEPGKEPRVVWASLSPQERASFITGDAGLPLKDRLLRVSERFLGTPYVHSPLGEGGGVDPDPTFRLDAVDCLTFVEQALAMSLATAEPEVTGLLERLRYASTPTYEDRTSWRPSGCPTTSARASWWT
jgi:hypothetical protein